MIASHLNYCILAWGYEHSRLNKIKKRVIRIINLSQYNDHTEPILKKLKLLKTKDILKLNELKFYHKIENKKLPAYFLDQPTLQNNPNNCEKTLSLKLNK